MPDVTLSNLDIIVGISNGIKNNEIEVYYQSQYNASNGLLVGSEALVRWISPKYGFVGPNRFIPVLEASKFVTELDLYVFEEVCKTIRHSLDNNYSVVHISVNVSRIDILKPGFIEDLELIRLKYNVPVKYLHIEITESTVMEDMDLVIEVIRQLHDYGYVVEMDDFGSGYSSLYVLADLDFDVIKLDMGFMRQKELSERGGIVLSSVVRMAKWLNLPVIAEGVETIEQAEYLKSIGCDLIQGYLYSRPIPKKSYIELISDAMVGFNPYATDMNLDFSFKSFWNPRSLDTIIFNDFVGPSALVEYSKGRFEILRINSKYVHEIGMLYTESEILKSNLIDSMDDVNKEIYLNMLNSCIQTSEEQCCETWRIYATDCCGTDKLCIRSNCILIGHNQLSSLFFVTIRNVTDEKLKYIGLKENEKVYKNAIEQAHVYAWEYNVQTKEMHPCFRCMKDLGLPPVVRNYPEPVISSGLIPEEFAQMYRDWHKQIENGVKFLEAEIKLTAGKVPFMVRYTTEFDELGHPIKAYGSATEIIK